MPWCCNLSTRTLSGVPSRSMTAGSPTALQAGLRRRASKWCGPGFEWTPVVVEPAIAEVAEVVYRDDDSSDQYAYFESIGLTVLNDRMMITVHTFYTDESPYSVSLGEEEAGFAHPQLGMVEAAARRLAE